MWKTSRLLATLLLTTQGSLLAESTAPADQTIAPAANKSVQPTSTEASQPPAPFSVFTGKVIKNKVRLRTQPNLDAPIIREINRDDLFIVVGESDEFYAVAPPEGTKAYIFRTFVLENTVEGSHVNVRLAPDLEAPVIAQLNSGDHVYGKISPQNTKWLEIAAPTTTRFYIAKEYIQNIGGPDLLAKMAKRRDEVDTTLKAAVERSQMELKKPFDQIQLEPVTISLNKVIQNYSEFHEQTSKAKELLTQINETYLQKKIAYLESKSKMTAEKPAPAAPAPLPPTKPTVEPPAKTSPWDTTESALWLAWKEKGHPNDSKEDFYKEQKTHAVTLKGMIEPYQRAIKNKPGDYVLINSFNNLPVAYLYSTLINLQDYLGHEITLHVVERPNNNFAYPAYFVLEVE